MPCASRHSEIKTYEGKHGYPAKSDLLLADAKSKDFCGLLVPGGFMPDKLRRDPKVLSLTREFFEQGKLVAFICHGGWIPISAKILQGKRATGSLGIKDDLENAGAIWVNEPVVVDGNLISSRTPLDLAPFGQGDGGFPRRATFADMSHHARSTDPTFSARKALDVGSGPARRRLSAALQAARGDDGHLRGAVLARVVRVSQAHGLRD